MTLGPFQYQSDRTESEMNRQSRRISPAAAVRKVHSHGYGPGIAVEIKSQRPKPSLNPDVGRIFDASY